MTPIELIIKEYIREFFKNRMQVEKNNTANMAIGFVLKEVDMEKFIDEMWFFINKKMLESKQNEESSSVTKI